MAALNVPSATLAVFLSAAFVVLKPSGYEPRQAPRQSNVPLHVQRGNKVQEKYDAYTERLHAYYESLVAALQVGTPELLPILEPPHPLQHGYQILPNIVPDPAPLTKSARPQSAQYSWPWTDHLIESASSEVGQSVEELRRALSLEPKMQQVAYRQLATRYRKMRAQQQNIDAHIQYNRLWQGAIAANRSKYDRENVLHDQVLKRQEILDVFRARNAAALTHAHGTIHQMVVASLNEISSGLTERGNLLAREIDAATDLSFIIPGYVRIEQQISNWIIHVPFYTDIQDNEFVLSVKNAIEDTWHLRSSENEFRIALEFSYVSPEYLYGTHEPPRKVTRINIQDHVDRFPPGRAILTTGALTTHARGRAIILGPHEITKRILAHEFGHILGFRDDYFRGYKDLGEDGFQVREVVADANDLMGAPSTGAVLRRHYDRIIASHAINNCSDRGCLEIRTSSMPMTTCNGRTLNSTDLKTPKPVEFIDTLASESRRTTAATRRSYNRNDDNRKHAQADKQCYG
ncbi:MAG TPA: hypothetical protein VF182_06370 [Candidatus Binatia bacterium]